jgi:hypothetical protein
MHHRVTACHQDHFLPHQCKQRRSAEQADLQRKPQLTTQTSLHTEKGRSWRSRCWRPGKFLLTHPKQRHPPESLNKGHRRLMPPSVLQPTIFRLLFLHDSSQIISSFNPASKLVTESPAQPHRRAALSTSMVKMPVREYRQSNPSYRLMGTPKNPSQMG